MGWFRRGRAGRTFGALVLSVGVLAGSACTRPVPAIEPATGFTDMVRQAMPGGPAPGPRPWFCHSEGVGTGPIHGGIANDWYAGKAKGELSWDDCLSVAGFFDKALASARRFPTRKDAQAAGAAQAIQHVDGTGTHDIVPGVNTWQYDAPDPEHPFYLQYDGDGPDAPLAGMSWYVVRYQPGPPPGLAGDNDWWHTHAKICYWGPGVGVGDELTDAECAARGGRNVAWPYGWMVHAWIVPGYEERHDVFAGAHGCVDARTGPYAAPDDPCQTRFRDGHHPSTQVFPGPPSGVRPPPGEVPAAIPR
jgi:hypothetical protein